MPELDADELLARVGAAAQARWPGAAFDDLRRLPGGVSSLTYAARLTAPPSTKRQVVLKVAPPGLPPVRNRDVLRQARVLRALADVPGVAVPEVLLEDGDAPPLFVMAFVDGQSYEAKIDVSSSPPAPDVVKRRARAAARMLARLQDVEPRAVGLGDEPVLSLLAELGRWDELFATVDETLRPGAAQLHRRLARRAPRGEAPRILHGDYRLANMQFDGDRLAAIIDWEIWSVGDPRTDLAWLLMHSDPVHRFVTERSEADVRAGEGMPGRDELLAEYLAVRPVEPAELGWFLAYCHYKTASTIAVLVKQSRRRDEPDPRLETAAETLAPLIERGEEILGAASARG